LTNTTTLSLTVNPTVVAQLSVSPTSVNFGSNLLGRPTKKVVTVTNNGATKVAIGPITLDVTQGDASQFTLGHVCPAKLLAGKSCTIAVNFTPDAVGSDAATLNIANNAGSPLQVPLTGAGVQKKH
jgi:trimeric autotransporter adhesin